MRVAALREGTGLVSAALGLAAWAVASAWLQRVRAAAAPLDPGGMRRSAAWTWLGWVVPVVLFWFPKQIVDDSADAFTRAGRRPADSAPSTGWWWTAWIAFLIFSRLRDGALEASGYGAPPRPR